MINKTGLTLEYKARSLPFKHDAITATIVVVVVVVVVYILVLPSRRVASRPSTHLRSTLSFFPPPAPRARCAHAHPHAVMAMLHLGSFLHELTRNFSPSDFSPSFCSSLSPLDPVSCHHREAVVHRVDQEFCRQCSGYKWGLPCQTWGECLQGKDL